MNRPLGVHVYRSNNVHHIIYNFTCPVLKRGVIFHSGDA